MNLREGRVGRQEGILAGVVLLTVSGLFASDPRGELYNGNGAYLYLPLSLAAALGVFLFVGAAMKRRGVRDLTELQEIVLGPVASLWGVVHALALCGACASALNHFVMLLHRYVFVGADYPALVLYCAGVPFFLSWKGLECISRTVKCLAWVLLASLLAELVFARDAYETYRLFPLLGEGGGAMLRCAATGMGLFLPAFSVLFLLGQGLQGQANAKKYGIIAAVGAGVLLFCAYFAIALAFPYNDVGEVFSPLYRMSSLGRGNKYQLRLDKILLFLWLSGGMVAAATYNYAAALQFAKSFHQGDIRPAAGAFSLLAAGLVLLHQSAQKPFDIMAAITRYGSYVMLILLLFPAGIALLKRKGGHP